MATRFPETLGPYRIERVIATGGMGAVYLAHDERLGRRVAIKHVRPDKELGPSAARRLRREARAAAALAHPAIVQVFDILETDGEDWVVMEYIDGPTLGQLNRDGPLDVARVVGLARDVAEGLAYAHGQGFVHRDLKSENVMVSHLGQAKILDFGLVKRISHEPGATLTGDGAVVGTCRSMSPEQAQGFKVDTRSDLFSFGILLYECLTGISPFAKDSDAVTLARICLHEPEVVSRLNPDVPAQLSDLVVRLLEKLPERRPRDSRSVADELEELARRRGSTDPPISTEPPSLPKESETIASYSTWDDATVRPPELSKDGFLSLQRHDRPGRIDQAIEAFEAALARDPEFALAHAGLARAFWRKHSTENEDPLWLERARQAARRSIELDGGLAAAHVSLGLVLGELGHDDDARAAFGHALRLDPGDADAHRGLGDVYFSQGKMEPAEASYREAIGLDPGAWEHHSQLGTLCFRLARHLEAEASFLNVLELTPDNFTAHRNLAVVYATLGRFDEAVEQSRAALEIKPSHSIYSNLGTFLFWQGRYPEAADAFKKAVDLGANSYHYWANLADAYRLVPGKKRDADTAYLRATQLLREKLAPSPDNGSLRSHLAVILAKRGHAEGAAAEADAASSLAGDEPESWFKCTLAYELTGHREKALEALGKALSAGYLPDLVKYELDLTELRRDVRYHALVMDFEKSAREP